MSYNNYNNRGSYGNTNGQYSGYRNSGNAGGRNKNDGQQEKMFGARFRIRGIACTNKDTGDGFTKINTKNGSSMCSVNVMIKKFRNTGDVDRDGRPVWNESFEYIRLVAFGKNADIVMSMVKAKSILDFSGDIVVRRLENGSYDTSFVIDKVDMVKEYTGMSNSNQQPIDRYKMSNGRRNGVSYNDRPNNYSQRAQQQERIERPPEPQEDYAQSDGDSEDIPF